VRIWVETYDDDTAPICVRFDSRGFRIAAEQAAMLADDLRAAVAELLDAGPGDGPGVGEVVGVATPLPGLPREDHGTVGEGGPAHGGALPDAGDAVRQEGVFGRGGDRGGAVALGYPGAAGRAGGERQDHGGGSES
jgi:hypothetical protein